MKIERMNKGEWGKVRAFFDIKTDEGLILKGFRLIAGTNGLFTGFPSQRGSDDEYRDTIYCEKSVRDQLTKLAIQHYSDGITADPIDPVDPGMVNSEDLPF